MVTIICHNWRERVLAKQISTDPMNRLNPRYKFGTWFGMRNNCAERFIGNADGVFRGLEFKKDWNSRADGAKKPSKNEK